MTRVLILGGDEGFAARVEILPGAQVVALRRETIESDRFDLMRSLDPQSLPDVIFFGDDLPVERSLSIAGAADERYPETDLVFVGAFDTEVIVEGMRRGVRDILPVDVGDSELSDVLRRAEKHRAVVQSVAAKAPPAPAEEEPPETSRVVTIVSPKGGVGKTSISTNLAIGLAQAYPSQVVLVDLDLQFGDVGSTLDMTPAMTIEDAFRPPASTDNTVLKTMLSVHESGLFVLCAADSPAANENVTGDQVRRLLSQLSAHFRFIVVDTAAGLDEPTLAALECTDDAILVSTMDVSCVRGVRKETQMLAELGIVPANRMLALNLADRQSGMKVKDVESVVGLPVDVVIPRTSDVQLASNHGQPLMLRRKKGGPFVKAILEVMDKLARVEAEPTNKHKRLEVA